MTLNTGFGIVLVIAIALCFAAFFITRLIRDINTSIDMHRKVNTLNDNVNTRNLAGILTDMDFRLSMLEDGEYCDDCDCDDCDDTNDNTDTTPESLK